MKTVIITGVTGQDGSHMADYLLANTDYNIKTSATYERNRQYLRKKHNNYFERNHA